MSSHLDNYFILAKENIIGRYYLACEGGFSSIFAARSWVLNNGLPAQVYLICGLTQHVKVKVTKELV